MPWVLLIVGIAIVMLLVGKTAMGYSRGVPFEIDLSPIGDGYYLSRDAAVAFGKMRADAAGQGVTFVVNDAFRTMAEQQDRWDHYHDESGHPVARPGWSNHQAGIAVDVATDNGSNAAFAWLTAHAARYDFKRIVPSEPWHWEYLP